MLVLLTIPASAQITSFSFGSPYRYNQDYPTKWILSDLYNPTLADNGVIYASNDDAKSGWSGTLAGGANCMFSSLDGYTSALTGTQVNAMTNFGPFFTTGSDGRTFKCSGLISVAGKLYLAVNRQSPGGSGVVGSCSNGVGESKVGAQIIESSDHGVTWTPQPPSSNAPYASPMWPTGFVDPWPVQYGQDYSCPNIDNCQTYVYWVSTPIYRSEDNTLLMARISKSDLATYCAPDSGSCASKFEYYKGGDGMSDAAWSASLGDAVSILTATCQMSENGIQYNATSGTYQRLDWYYPNWGDSSITVWTLRQASHPWGPYTTVGSPLTLTTGEYNPVVMPGSITSNSLVTVSAGNYNSQDPQTGLYTLTLRTMSFSVSTPTVIGQQLTPGTEVTAGVSIQ